MTKPVHLSVPLVGRRDLKNGYYALTFSGFKPAAKCRPGQFLHIRQPHCEILFRRAFSVASVDGDADRVEIIMKVLGRGTNLLSQIKKGDTVDILGPLGNSFPTPPKNAEVVMVAGGVGFPPLLFLAQRLVENGFPAERIHFFYGGRSGADIIERARIKRLGVSFVPVTEDGSFGARGLVTEPVEEFISEHESRRVRLYGCGPEGMLKATDALAGRLGVKGHLSFEAPMPCGIGVCLGCVVPLTEGGHARVCFDGPVFEVGEVIL